MATSTNPATLASTTTGTQNCGMRITMNSTQTCSAITKTSSCTATVCYIKNDSNGAIAQANFSGDVATFSQSLTSGVTYRIYVDAAGSSYTRSYDGSGGNTTLVNWLGGLFNNATDGNPHAIRSMTFVDPDVTVTPSAQTLTLTLTSSTPIDIEPPSAQALALTLQTPTVVMMYDITVTPAVQALTSKAMPPEISTSAPHIVVKTGTIKSAVVHRKYPAVTGLIAGTTRQEGNKEFVTVEEDATLKKDNKGLYK